MNVICGLPDKHDGNDKDGENDKHDGDDEHEICPERHVLRNEILWECMKRGFEYSGTHVQLSVSSLFQATCVCRAFSIFICTLLVFSSSTFCSLIKSFVIIFLISSKKN